MTHDDTEDEIELVDLRRQMAVFRVATVLDGGMFGFGLATPPRQIYLDTARCLEILQSPDYRTDAFLTPASNALH